MYQMWEISVIPRSFLSEGEKNSENFVNYISALELKITNGW
jgi:hypothetical protein